MKFVNGQLYYELYGLMKINMISTFCNLIQNNVTKKDTFQA